MSSSPEVDTPTTSTNYAVCSNPSINSIANPKIGKYNIHWIIDINTIYHITYSLKYFTIFHSIKPFIMNLPNGYQTTANVSGTVKISNQIT